MNASAFSDVLECPVCLDVFKDPLFLNNCGHTVCSKCVKDLIKAPPTRRSVICPECRTVSGIPRKGFKKNYRLADIVAKVEESRGSGAKLCNVCQSAVDSGKLYECRTCVHDEAAAKTAFVLCADCALDGHKDHDVERFKPASKPVNDPDKESTTGTSDDESKEDGTKEDESEKSSDADDSSETDDGEQNESDESAVSADDDGSEADDVERTVSSESKGSSDEDTSEADENEQDVPSEVEESADEDGSEDDEVEEGGSEQEVVSDAENPTDEDESDEGSENEISSDDEGGSDSKEGEEESSYDVSSDESDD